MGYACVRVCVYVYLYVISTLSMHVCMYSILSKHICLFVLRATDCVRLA
jgi:hypothetical protein